MTENSIPAHSLGRGRPSLLMTHRLSSQPTSGDILSVEYRLRINCIDRWNSFLEYRDKNVETMLGSEELRGRKFNSYFTKDLFLSYRNLKKWEIVKLSMRLVIEISLKKCREQCDVLVPRGFILGLEQCAPDRPLVIRPLENLDAYRRRDTGKSQESLRSLQFSYPV